MPLTPVEVLITVAMMVLGTMITRFLPFLCFPEKKKVPKYITYLGKTLPYAVMGFLVIYCLKGVSIVNKPYGMPELSALIFIFAIHLWKRNTFLSIFGGTIIYMLLSRLVFV